MDRLMPLATMLLITTMPLLLSNASHPAVISSISLSSTPLPAQQMPRGWSTLDEFYGSATANTVAINPESEATNAMLSVRAEAILQQALREAAGVPREQLSGAYTALASLAETCHTVKDTETVQLILGPILSEAETLDDSEYLKKSRLLVAIAKVYSQVDDREVATAGLERASAVAQTLEASEYRAKYKTEALSAIALAYSQQGNLTEAYKLLGQALEIAYAQGSSSQTLEALWPVINVHLDLEDITPSPIALAQIAQILEFTKSYDSEIWPFETLKSLPNVYMNINDAQTDAGKVAQALDMARTLKLSERTTFLTGLAIVIRKLDDTAAIGEGLAQIREAAQSTDTAEEDFLGTKVYLLTAVATAYGSIGEIEMASDVLVEALELAKTLEEPFKSWPLTFITEAYGQLGNTNAVMDGLAKTLKEARKLDAFARTLNFTEIANTYQQIGEKEAASAVLDEALELALLAKGEMFNPRNLGDIAAIYGRLGNTAKADQVIAQALKSAVKLGDDGWSSIEIQITIPSLIGLEDLAVVRGGLKRTLDATLKIRNPLFKSRTLIVIADAYRQSGDFSTADEILRKALKVTKTIKNPSPPQHFYVENIRGIVSVYSQIENSAIALEGLKQVVKFAEKIPRLSGQNYLSGFKSEALRMIAAAYQILGHPDIVEQVLEKALVDTNQLESSRDRVEQLILGAKAYLQLASGVPDALPTPLEKHEKDYITGTRR